MYELAIIVVGGSYSGLGSFMHTCQAIYPPTPTLSPFEAHLRQWSGQVASLELEPDLWLHVASAPSTPRFDALWEALQPALIGFIFLTNSLDPAYFYEAKIITNFYITYSQQQPHIIAATMPTHPDAWGLDDIRHVMDLAPQDILIPCATHNPEQVQTTLFTLVEHVSRQSAL